MRRFFRIDEEASAALLGVQTAFYDPYNITSAIELHRALENVLSVWSKAAHGKLQSATKCTLFSFHFM